MIEPGPESHTPASGHPGAVCVCAGAGWGGSFTAEEGAAPCPASGHPDLGGDPAAAWSSRTDLQETGPPAAL